MKKIIITEGNRDRVEALLAKHQKGARVRTMDCDDLTSKVRGIESYISRLGVPKKALVGLQAEIIVPFGGRRPACYKGIPMGTRVTIRRAATGWFITGIDRVEAKNPDSDWRLLNVDLVQEHILAFLSSF